LTALSNGITTDMRMDISNVLKDSRKVKAERKRARQNGQKHTDTEESLGIDFIIT